jgi:hypothetical protein
MMVGHWAKSFSCCSPATTDDSLGGGLMVHVHDKFDFF